ncbi:hypothetical protein [Alteribacillus sp. HJP-4]|uniref:hypothetical protein n=1 Tax=Alteribacillus sp. HJP-4 TaxID=2775394 RepID=UPI0035CCDD57
MKKLDWLIGLVFIAVGLHCLVISPFIVAGTTSPHAYLVHLLYLCIWILVPVCLGSIVYGVIRLKINNRKEKASKKGAP